MLLVAAEEDDDAFEHEHKLKRLPSLAKHVSVYFNDQDLALAISDKTKGNPDRLGEGGPRVPRGVPGKISLIDCTPVVHGVTEHGYFLDNRDVVADMRSVLSGLVSHEIEGRTYVQETNSYRLDIMD